METKSLHDSKSLHELFKLKTQVCSRHENDYEDICHELVES